MNVRGPFRNGALFVGLSAVFHMLSFILGGATPDTIALAIMGVIFLGFALGLLRNWRWFAYVVFIFMLFGVSAALSGALGASTVPGWWFVGMLIANICAALALFVALWRDPVASGA